MIFMAFTGAICGADGWTNVEQIANAKAEWFGRYSDLEHAIQQLLLAWLMLLSPTAGSYE